MVCVMIVMFKAAHMKKPKALYNAYRFMLLMCSHSNRMRIWLASLKEASKSETVTKHTGKS